EKKYSRIKDFVPLANIDDIVFGGWDVYNDNVFEAALNAKVLEPMMLHAVKDELKQIKPMKAVFDQSYVANLDGTHIKEATQKTLLAKVLMDDIENFKEANDCKRIVIVWCGSTEKYIEVNEVHKSIEAFEEGLLNNDPAISPSMIYAYAAIKLGIPFMNG